MTEKKTGKIDWLLLVFLWLLTNQAIFSLKVLGIAFIYLARWNWKFNLKNRRLPKFFILILVLACINYLFFIREFTYPYTVAFIVGNLFWIFSFLSSHQVKLSLEKYGYEGVYRTLKVFTVVNLMFCLGQLVNIMTITGTINPYNENLAFPYGMSTGDNIFGSFMQNSYYNVMVSSLLAVYFLFKRDVVFSILASICLILVFGNFGTMVYVGILTALFCLCLVVAILRFGVQTDFTRWLQKVSLPGWYFLYIPLMIGIAFVFYITLSPKNYDYIVLKFKDTVRIIRSSEKNNYANLLTDQKPKPQAFDPFSTYFDQVEDSLQKAGNILENEKLSSPESIASAKVALTNGYIRRLQGKNLSVIETVEYLKSSPTAFLFGAGTTRFSSLTAQKMSGYDSSRLFMNVLPHYKSKLYAENHYLLIDGRETAGDDALLSSANWPDSLYNQLFGEYGVLGALVFFIYYLGFYARRMKYWSYSFWLLCIFLPFAHLNYIFETLCVAPFFELLVEADIREHFEKSKLNA